MKHFQRNGISITSCSEFSCSLILRRVSIEYSRFPLFFEKGGYNDIFWDGNRICDYIVQTIEVSGIDAGIKYYRDWNPNRNRIEELTKEKKEAELSFLKAKKIGADGL